MDDTARRYDEATRDGVGSGRLFVRRYQSTAGNMDEYQCNTHGR